VPFGQQAYYDLRPTLSIPPNEVLPLSDTVALHPGLSGLKDLFDGGHLAVVQGVGYPNPNRSHFRSMDIWQTGSASTEFITTGWIGRYLDAQCHGCDKPTYALELDDTLSLAMKGEEAKAIAMKDPRRLFGTANQRFFKDVMQNHKDEPGEQPVDYLYKTLAETVSSADYIFEKSKFHPSNAEYPKTDIGQNLKTIASLVFSDINTKVYYVSHGSFDTHVNQQAQQQRLFTEMNDAIKAFTKDLKDNGRFNDVLVMTFSEFGRRVSQNASGGTDHGTANNMFLISGALKQKGVINALPDLSDLQEGDLKYKVDFKNVYATVLNKWLDADDTKILGKKFEYLNFL
jgi:uncharacterized protein (DUF1501 family)